MKKEFTTDFQIFVDAVSDINYQEVYDLYQAAMDCEQSTFTREQANNSDDIIIGYEPANFCLRLTPKALAYFPKWIEQNLMSGTDAESYWGDQHAKEKSNEEDAKMK